jgi:hypothetical protein
VDRRMSMFSWKSPLRRQNCELVSRSTRGKHFAHAAPIGWKLVIQLAEDAADMRGAFDQGDPIAELRKVQGGADTTDATANDECLADFRLHR